MSSTLSTTWVKNVYSLRMNSGIDRGETFVSYTPPTLASMLLWVQTFIFTQFSPMLSAVLPTIKNAISLLLLRQLYPLSTVPTIKKKKENKERNS